MAAIDAVAAHFVGMVAPRLEEVAVAPWVTISSHNIGKPGMDGRLDGHANPEQPGKRLVRRHNDLYWQALHDLGKVAGAFSGGNGVNVVPVAAGTSTTAGQV